MSRPVGNESYIVRIYRRDSGDPGVVVGTVEEVGVEDKRGFGSFDELRGILSVAPRPVPCEPGAAHPKSRRKP